MKICIHRGTSEIGGTCIEIVAGQAAEPAVEQVHAQGYERKCQHQEKQEHERAAQHESRQAADGAFVPGRLILDMGTPLVAQEGAEASLPDITGLTCLDESLKGIIISHGHRDHWGLLPKVTSKVPLIFGEATQRILAAAAPFMRNRDHPRATHYLRDRETITLPPFAITPFLIDHSAFDAYALLVEADGKRLFYTGDFRLHGRKHALVEKLMASPPQDIDLLLIEGTSLGRVDDEAQFPSETDIEMMACTRFRATHGIALVAASPQNVDRIVTIYRAARRSRRALVLDPYATAILAATGRSSIPGPRPDWPNVRFWLPKQSERYLARKDIAAIVAAASENRIETGEIAANPGKFVLLFRANMFDELAAAGALDGAFLFWSQWRGYLENNSTARLQAACAEHAIAIESLHTSGHASPRDLQKLAKALSPRKVVPVHTEAPAQYARLMENVHLARDGEWFAI